jgi:c-di-AMP phosphodiesterase-like protein
MSRLYQFAVISLIVLGLLTIISMILAITVSSYFWIAFVIFLILLLPVIWLFIKRSSKGKSSFWLGGYSPLSGSESSLDNY